MPKKLLILLLCMLLGAACTEEVPLPTQAQPLPTVPTAPPTATDLPPDDPAMMHIGDTVRGALQEGSEPQNWFLNAAAGSYIKLQITRFNEGLNARVLLLAPNGELVSQFGVGGDYELSPAIWLPYEGRYTLQVISGGGAGDYALMVVDGTEPVEVAALQDPDPTEEIPFAISTTPTPEVTATPTLPIATRQPTASATPPPPTPTLQEPGGRIALGETRRSAITQSGEVHRYTLFGTAQSTLSILANIDPQNPGILNPYIEVQAPNGQIIAENDDLLPGVPDALIRDLELPLTGVYTVYMKSRDELGTGGYLLTLNTGFTLRDVERGEALRDTPNDQVLETYAARDVWVIPANQGDLISIAVEVLDPTTGLDAMTELVAQDGTVLGFDVDSGADGGAILAAIPIPADGVYTIHIAARNNAAIGGYRLWWHNLNAMPTAPPAPPTAAPISAPPRNTLEASVAAGDVYRYEIQANALQDINIVVLGKDGFDPVLRLIDPFGNIFREVDDVGQSQDPRLNVIAEPSGSYTIEVFGYEGTAGSFTLNYIVQ